MDELIRSITLLLAFWKGGGLVVKTLDALSEKVKRVVIPLVRDDFLTFPNRRVVAQVLRESLKRDYLDFFFEEFEKEEAYGRLLSVSELATILTAAILDVANGFNLDSIEAERLVRNVVDLSYHLVDGDHRRWEILTREIYKIFEELHAHLQSN